MLLLSCCFSHLKFNLTFTLCLMYNIYLVRTSLRQLRSRVPDFGAPFILTLSECFRRIRLLNSSDHNFRLSYLCHLRWKLLHLADLFWWNTSWEQFKFKIQGLCKDKFNDVLYGVAARHKANLRRIFIPCSPMLINTFGLQSSILLTVIFSEQHQQWTISHQKSTLERNLLV